MKIALEIIIVSLFTIVILGFSLIYNSCESCHGPTPTPSPEPTSATIPPTFTNSPSFTPTCTLSQTPTETAIDTPTPTSTPYDTFTPTTIITSTPTASFTPSFTATPTATRTPTATYSPSPTIPCIHFDRDLYIGYGDRAVITVYDPSANKDPKQQEQVTIHVSEAGSCNGIQCILTLNLTETSRDSGIFSTHAALKNIGFGHCGDCGKEFAGKVHLSVESEAYITALYTSYPIMDERLALGKGKLPSFTFSKDTIKKKSWGRQSNPPCAAYARWVETTITPTFTPTVTPRFTCTNPPTPEGAVYFDSFEVKPPNGMEWTLTRHGFWHYDGPSSRFPEVHTGCRSLHFANKLTGNYDTGEIVKADAITPLFYVQGQCYLKFWSFEEVQPDHNGWYDIRMVFISPWDDQLWYPIWMSSLSKCDWREVTIDLSMYQDTFIQLLFHFNSMTRSKNNYRGWYIDDIAVFPYPEDTRLIPKKRFAPTKGFTLEELGGYPLGPPSGIQSREITGGVGLTWEEVSGAEGYRVYRYEGPASGYTTLQTEFEDYTAKEGVSYLYEVCSLSPEGSESEPSEPVEGMWARPSPPSGFSAFGSDGTVYLEWICNPVEEQVAEYLVYDDYATYPIKRTYWCYTELAWTRSNTYHVRAIDEAYNLSDPSLPASVGEPDGPSPTPDLSPPDIYLEEKSDWIIDIFHYTKPSVARYEVELFRDDINIDSLTCICEGDHEGLCSYYLEYPDQPGVYYANARACSDYQGYDCGGYKSSHQVYVGAPPIKILKETNYQVDDGSLFVTFGWLPDFSEELWYYGNLTVFDPMPPYEFPEQLTSSQSINFADEWFDYDYTKIQIQVSAFDYLHNYLGYPRTYLWHIPTLTPTPTALQSGTPTPFRTPPPFSTPTHNGCGNQPSIISCITDEEGCFLYLFGDPAGGYDQVRIEFENIYEDWSCPPIAPEFPCDNKPIEFDGDPDDVELRLVHYPLQDLGAELEVVGSNRYALLWDGIMDYGDNPQYPYSLQILPTKYGKRYYPLQAKVLLTETFLNPDCSSYENQVGSQFANLYAVPNAFDLKVKNGWDTHWHDRVELDIPGYHSQVDIGFWWQPEQSACYFKPYILKENNQTIWTTKPIYVSGKPFAHYLESEPNYVFQWNCKDLQDKWIPSGTYRVVAEISNVPGDSERQISLKPWLLYLEAPKLEVIGCDEESEGYVINLEPQLPVMVGATQSGAYPVYTYEDDQVVYDYIPFVNTNTITCKVHIPDDEKWDPDWRGELFLRIDQGNDLLDFAENGQDQIVVELTEDILNPGTATAYVDLIAVQDIQQPFSLVTIKGYFTPSSPGKKTYNPCEDDFALTIVVSRPSLWVNGVSFIKGFIGGSNGEAASTFGDIASSVLIWGDVRDLVVELYNLIIPGQEFDEFKAGFAAIGLGFEFGSLPADIPDFFAATIKSCGKTAGKKLCRYILDVAHSTKGLGLAHVEDLVRYVSVRVPQIDLLCRYQPFEFSYLHDFLKAYGDRTAALIDDIISRYGDDIAAKTVILVAKESVSLTDDGIRGLARIIKEHSEEVAGAICERYSNDVIEKTSLLFLNIHESHFNITGDGVKYLAEIMTEKEYDPFFKAVTTLKTEVSMLTDNDFNIILKRGSNGSDLSKNWIKGRLGERFYQESGWYSNVYGETGDATRTFVDFADAPNADDATMIWEVKTGDLNYIKRCDAQLRNYEQAYVNAEKNLVLPDDIYSNLLSSEYGEELISRGWNLVNSGRNLKYYEDLMKSLSK